MFGTKAKYLIKCEIPGCKNAATHMYHQGTDSGCRGIAICSHCVKDLAQTTKTKKQESEVV